MRIVSLCPSNTELLDYMGLSSALVGVDNYSDWPAQVNELPRLGSDLDIDMDAVEQLKPDLILASLSVPGMENNITRLRERNLPHIIIHSNQLSEIADDFTKIGEAMDTMQQAREAHDRFHQQLDEFKERTRQVIERPNIYWEWWSKPVFTPGGANWLTEISELAGGRNIFADQNQASVQTDWEEVRLRNPDIICLAWVGIRQELVKPELVKQRPGWQELQAIRDNKIHIMEEPLYCRPSPRLLIGIQKLAELLHPEIFET